MQGSWNNDQAYYRCTYPSEYARTNDIRHPRVVYLREAEILPELDTWLVRSLDHARLPATIEALAASQDDAVPRELASLREQIGACDQKLAQYRAALDSGADPAVVGQWITETQARKLAADARLRAATGSTRPGPAKMTKEQIAATVNAIKDLMQALRNAATEDKAEIYAALNLQLTYHPGERTVTTRAEVGQTCTKGSCPRGDLNPHFGAISPDRGNHAIRVTRAGRTHPVIPRRVRFLSSHPACAWLRRRVPGRLTRE
jgi:site-specific DNA recombinase